MARCNSSLYPTRQHEEAALYATEFFSEQESVDAVLLTCSCARGKAAPSSCVDISVLLRSDTDLATRERLNGAWAKHSEGASVVAALAYQQSTSLVAFIIHRYGFYKVLKMIEHYANGRTTEQVLKREFYQIPDQFMNDWKTYLYEYIVNE